MYDFLWPHRLKPARLLCPWDFSGKNAGVGCHVLLLSIYILYAIRRKVIWYTLENFVKAHLHYTYSLESESHSVMSNSLQPHGLYSPWNSPGQNTGVGSLSFLQWIFPTQESNWGFQHWRRILYQLSYQGSPFPYLPGKHIPLLKHYCRLEETWPQLRMPSASSSTPLFSHVDKFSWAWHTQYLFLPPYLYKKRLKIWPSNPTAGHNTPRKPELKETRVPQCSLQHCL